MRDAAERGLGLAALALLDDGGSAADLADRFGAAGVVVGKIRASQLLARLAELGLVRISSDGGADQRYVCTTLGRRRLNAPASDRLDDELRELERLRGDLLSTVAHELRTPLTAIRTSVGLLLDTSVRPDASDERRLLTAIARSSEQMQRLVADVLDVARFRSGAIRLQLRQLDAVELAAEAIASIQPLLDAKEQPVTLDAPVRPLAVFGDRRRLVQVLTNLLSNANAYSPEGASVAVRVERAGHAVTWSVVDHGSGIGDEDRARLFERFFTGGARGGGAGLGLPISLAIAEAHGGGIEVDSRPGEGSTFRLRIPAAGPSEAEL